LPEAARVPTPFERAAGVIEEWLDGPGAAFAVRTHQPDPRRKLASWDLELDHPTVGTKRATLYLPPDFPATPPQVRFRKELCLVLPHIEEDGRFCHGVEAAPQDYDAPVEAAKAVLERLKEFWADSSDPAWVNSEFQRESLSYWSRFVAQYKPVRGVQAAYDVRVALAPLDGPTEGRFAAYFKEGKKTRSERIVAVVGDADPHGLAVRHGWSVGTVIRGAALFVPLDQQHPWGPDAWPRTAEQLDVLVGQASDHTLSVIQWFKANVEESPNFLLVVLACGGTCYGYLVYPPPVALLTPSAIYPVAVDRVDADWALARDHGLEVLHQRRSKRVLVLGCGSLGAPAAELLARAGIGELHLLDKEFFGVENCARHMLGAADIAGSKSLELAARLRKLVPGAAIKPFHALATDWVRHQCKPGTYDLVVDCTGDRAVRVALAHYRQYSLGDCTVVHAWMEPYCAAAHVVVLQPGDVWPLDDPYKLVNVASWPAETAVKLPACNAGFHPYGAADVWQAAGFAAERILAALDGKMPSSEVWSWVRSKAFFDALPVQAQIGPQVPGGTSPLEARTVRRTYVDVFGN
jgi:hypothetical protein